MVMRAEAVDEAEEQVHHLNPTLRPLLIFSIFCKTLEAKSPQSLLGWIHWKVELIIRLQIFLITINNIFSRLPHLR